MKRFLKIFTIFVIAIGLLYLYARYVGTSGLEVKEYKVESTSLPTSFHGLKIVHFSDLHYGRILYEEKVEKIVTKINELKPDIVVFTGDLIDDSDAVNEASINFLKEELNKIEAKIGKYAIYGNHDYEVGTDIIKNIYNDSNFIVLENSYDTIYNKQDKIFISGIDDIIYGSPNLDFLDSTETNAYQITLVHEGDYAKDILEKNPNTNLILAGHSHNGQIVIPFYGAIYTPKGSKIYYKEHYTINNTELYVSSGIGVSKINLRLFNRPSINFYRFYAK